MNRSGSMTERPQFINVLINISPLSEIYPLIYFYKAITFRIDLSLLIRIIAFHSFYKPINLKLQDLFCNF